MTGHTAPHTPASGEEGPVSSREFRIATAKGRSALGPTVSVHMGSLLSFISSFEEGAASSLPVSLQASAAVLEPRRTRAGLGTLHQTRLWAQRAGKLEVWGPPGPPPGTWRARNCPRKGGRKAGADGSLNRLCWGEGHKVRGCSCSARDGKAPAAPQQPYFRRVIGQSYL